MLLGRKKFCLFVWLDGGGRLGLFGNIFTTSVVCAFGTAVVILDVGVSVSHGDETFRKSNQFSQYILTANLQLNTQNCVSIPAKLSDHNMKN